MITVENSVDKNLWRAAAGINRPEYLQKPAVIKPQFLEEKELNKFFPCSFHMFSKCSSEDPNDKTKWCQECVWAEICITEQDKRETTKQVNQNLCLYYKTGCLANIANMSMWCGPCMKDYRLMQVEQKRALKLRKDSERETVREL